MAGRIFVAVVLFIIFCWVIGRWQENQKRKAAARRKLELEEAERRKKAEEQERGWHSYYEQQLHLARAMRRSDKEIEQWAKQNFRAILEKEGQTISEVQAKFFDWRNYLLKKPAGKEVLDWWMEPIKEIKAAKRFVSQGGEYLSQLERRLQQEQLEAEVLKMRQQILKQLDEAERLLAEVGQRPMIHEVQVLERGGGNGILAKIKRSLSRKN